MVLHLIYLFRSVVLQSVTLLIRCETNVSHPWRTAETEMTSAVYNIFQKCAKIETSLTHRAFAKRKQNLRKTVYTFSQTA